MSSRFPTSYTFAISLSVCVHLFPLSDLLSVHVDPCRFCAVSISPFVSCRFRLFCFRLRPYLQHLCLDSGVLCAIFFAFRLPSLRCHRVGSVLSVLLSIFLALVSNLHRFRFAPTLPWFIFLAFRLHVHLRRYFKVSRVSLFGFGMFLRFDFLAIVFIVSRRVPFRCIISGLRFFVFLFHGPAFPLLCCFPSKFLLRPSTPLLLSSATFARRLRTLFGADLRRLLGFRPSFTTSAAVLLNLRLLSFVATSSRATFFVVVYKRPLLTGRSVLSLCL